MGLDKFYLDGKRLILISGTQGSPGSIYRTEVDSFQIIEAVGSGALIDGFKVTDKDGTVMRFGKVNNTTDAYQQLEQGAFTGTYESRAYTYALKEVKDALGRQCLFTYKHNAHGGHELSQIDYGVVNITLNQEARTDASLCFVNGRSWMRLNRLSEIIVSVSGNQEYKYALSYENAPMGGPSRLKEIQMKSVPGGRRSFELKPTVLKWSNQWDVSSGPNEVKVSEYGKPTYPDNPRYKEEAQHYFPGDFNGDGLTDSFFDLKMEVQLNNGNSGYLPPKAWSSTFDTLLGSIYPLTDIHRLVFVADINGDGRDDLVLIDDKKTKIYALVSTGSTFVGLDGGTNPSLVCDLIPGGSYPTAQQASQQILNDPDGSGSFMINRALLTHDGPSLRGRITVADFTGDGRADIAVHSYDGYVRVLVSLGTSFSNPIKGSLKNTFRQAQLGS